VARDGAPRGVRDERHAAGGPLLRRARPSRRHVPGRQLRTAGLRRRSPDGFDAGRLQPVLHGRAQVLGAGAAGPGDARESGHAAAARADHQGLDRRGRRPARTGLRRRGRSEQWRRRRHRYVHAAGSGFSSLCAVWQDPDFQADQRAFYYARVLENPSCRWSQRECNASGITCDGATPSQAGFEACCDGSVPQTIQERAWTSPIWYTPNS